MKLKTLKELDIIKEPKDAINVGFDNKKMLRERAGYCCGHSDACYNLKQEAINYIKEIIRIAKCGGYNFSIKDLPQVKFKKKKIEFNNNKWKSESPEFKFFLLANSSYIVMTGILAHFFNITNKDLK